ncbi:hypothetical protein [Lyngbya confervoides]|uniref:Uncharacterized protein n=1 Tax=Lyngbya confervoides BDU141951 TaxID=1574623 RepID=A0ABD4T1G5_9CYAN|nr:hypothetical protein [Lyngbya confervoides]MCM1982611.1 hypothetical protein [Lyngbya confervoides BDU141951]
MKTSELIRVIGLTVVGGVLMFVLQPALYTNRLIRISDLQGKVDAWVSNYYMPGALTVFLASVVALVIWLVSNRFSKAHRADEVDRWRIIWWLVGLIPVLAILAAIFLFKGSDGALPSLTTFFVLDGLWLYWLTTVTSTPFPFTYLPPLAPQIRGLIGA